MNWDEIINNSNLLYASESRDIEFRKIRLREQLYSVKYYVKHPLTPIDSTIIETLNFNNGVLNDLEFATILGFNVKDDITEKRYCDHAEKEIFDQIIKEVSKFDLISVSDHTIRLTHLGYRAIHDGVKYEFKSGYKPLLDFYDLKNNTSYQDGTFPFYEVLGLETSLRESANLDYSIYNNSEVLETILNADSALIRRFNLQSSQCPNIFEAEIADGVFIQEKRLRDIEVDFRIFQHDSKIYPVAFYKDKPCIALNTILWHRDNEEFIQEKRLQGLYLYTIRKSNIPLDLDALRPYYKYWDVSEIINCDRFIWSDANLFKLIQVKSSGNDWVQISKRCPLNILPNYIPYYTNSWDWTILSFRCEDEYITRTISDFPWDFTILSQGRDIEFLKPLIVRPDLYDKEWDWEEIIPRLDIPFIVNNLSILDLDLALITEDVLESFSQSILDYPDKKWDWKYISCNAPIQFIYTNLTIFGNYLLLQDIIDRIFVDSYFVDKFCHSTEFRKIVTNQNLSSLYNANLKEFFWTPTMIDWLESFNLVFWKSTSNSLGLECNPYIIWSAEMLEKYCGVDFSNEGLQHISQYVVDTNIITKHLDFPWDWDILSQRDIVKTDLSFIKSTHHKLNLSVLLPELTQDMVVTLYEDSCLATYMSNENLQSIITTLLPREVIIRHINDNWDWNILTSRFCTILNIDNLGKPQWINKWNWNYLSKHLDVEVIKDKIDLFIEKWDWEILTERLGHNFVIDNLPEYKDHWDWKKLINKILEPEDFSLDKYLPMISICLNTLDDALCEELWSDLTYRIPTDRVVKVITKPHDNKLFRFNYVDIYNRRDFNIHYYLDIVTRNSSIYIDWEALSRSKALNATLFWDKKVIKDYRIWVDNVLELISNEEYKWDFKYLSQLDSINWCDTILKCRTGEWNWDYICEHSSLFKESKLLIKHILKFEDYINFQILSNRGSLKISDKDFDKVSHLPWDWKLLSKNKNVKIPITFMQQHEDYDWDWFEISSRGGFVVPFTYICEHDSWLWNWEKISANYQITFDVQNFLKLKDKKWNWNDISNRKEIVFTEDVILALKDKPLDWKHITRRDDFDISIASISLIPCNEVSWDYISTKSDLTFDFIDRYKELLDWKVLTNTSSIDISSDKYLEAFYDYLDWKLISKSSLFKVNKTNLDNYKYYLDWREITRRRDFDISLVDGFEDYIDWSYFSRTTQIALTPDIIEKYANRWDWIELSKNINFAEHNLNDYYPTKLNLAKFYEHVASRRYEPAIYHFSHMFNAIEIIRSRKILSRNKAKSLGLLKYDAAGSVVNRTEKAHPYARFYFRTGTQTQFYNEFLGKQVGTKYYSKAEDNGVPMCPMPIFFKFDLQEVLMAYGERCHYSTGNMQSSAAKIKQVVRDPYALAVTPLFSNGHSPEEQAKRQQEFLIPDEFDFSRLKNYQIICYDKTQLRMLEALFEGDPIVKHFVSVGSTMVEDVFLNDNPHLHFNIDERKITISTNYQGRYHFMITSEDLSQIKVGDRKNTIQQLGNEISFKDKVNVELPDSSLEIYYICDNPRARSKKWLIYKQ